MQQLPPRVLVLEDDDQVRSVVTETLRGHGMRVDTAGDGLTALEKIDAGDFDLIIADVRLPGGLDGLDTVRCARARHPCLRSLFISGKVMPTLEDPEADAFVMKPFVCQELLGCVWELLLREVPQRHWCDRRRMAERAIAVGKVDCLRKKRSL
jgi:two-component system response regulator MprA